MRGAAAHRDAADDALVRVRLEELVALGAGTRRRHGHERAATSRATGPGDLRSRERGRGIEFEELRAYQAGDDVRRIHWRGSARVGRLLSRLHDEEREGSVLVAVDQRGGMFFGARDPFKSVVAARVAARRAWVALAHGERVGGLVAAEAVVATHAGRTRRAVLRLLEATVAANRALDARSGPGIALDAFLAACLVHGRGAAHIVIVSDFAGRDEGLDAALAALGQGRRVELLRVSDPLERALDAQGRVGISDGRERRELWLDASLRARYRAARAAREERLEAAAAAAGATLVDLSTDEREAGSPSFGPRR